MLDVVEVSGDVAFPTDSLSDLVAYADQVSRIEVVAVELGDITGDHPESMTQERSVTVEIIENYWVNPTVRGEGVVANDPRALTAPANGLRPGDRFTILDLPVDVNPDGAPTLPVWEGGTALLEGQEYLTYIGRDRGTPYVGQTAIVRLDDADAPIDGHVDTFGVSTAVDLTALTDRLGREEAALVQQETVRNTPSFFSLEPSERYQVLAGTR